MQPGMEKIEGKRVSLRLVTVSDAAYIHALRNDPRYNTHLSTVTGDVQDQRAWIESYKKREAAGSEYYYIIERCSDQLPCGVVRLYDILEGRFTWGSWILDENKPSKAALESTYLVYLLAFDMLGLARAEFDVRRDNENTLAFHRRFGATETLSNDEDRSGAAALEGGG